MLAIDKKRDLSVLMSFGINENSIKKIFLFEGLIIASLGVCIGTGIGILICFIQEKFGLISLGMNTAIIEYYPVKIYMPDIVMIVMLVFIITIIASIKPSQIAIQKINLSQLNNK